MGGERTGGLILEDLEGEDDLGPATSAFLSPSGWLLNH